MLFAPLMITLVLVSSTPGFPLKVSNDHRYLVDRQGRPFFVMGDTPWFLQKLPLDDVRRIMDDRQAKGFNTLFLEILDDSRLPSRDALGNLAFEPGTDITKPVEAYWRYADTVMDEAANRGFFVIMSNLWFGAGKGLWMHHVTPESAKIYGHFLGRRYRGYRNLMWMNCGDRNPEGQLAECTRQLARAIREEAPDQLQTAHLSPGYASSTFFAGDSWLDVNMAYTYGASHLQVSKEYERKHPVRPIILGETGYEDEPNAIELLPDAKRGDLWTPYRIRRNAYWALLSGACGYCAGTRLWRFDPHWQSLLDARSTREAPLMLRLLEPRPWWRLVPDTNHELVTAGSGSPGSAGYVTAARADDGSFALVYLPGSREVTVNLGKLKQPAHASWFDPTTGESRSIQADPLPDRGSRSFTPPGRNAAGEPDWILVLEAR